MRILALLFLILFANTAFPHEIAIALTENRTKNTTHFVLDLPSARITNSRNTNGTSILPISSYRIVSDHLTDSSETTNLSKATDILFQGQVDEFDIVIIRYEYNSFANPLRILTAVAGHPIQVSRILCLVIRNGHVVAKRTLAQEPSSYDWQASLFLLGAT